MNLPPPIVPLANGRAGWDSVAVIPARARRPGPPRNPRLRDRTASVALVSRLTRHRRWLTAVQLSEQPLAVPVASDHPRVRSASTTIRNPASAPIVTLKPGFGLRGSSDELVARAGVLPTIVFEGEDLHTVYGLVASGPDFGIVPGCGQIRLNDPATPRTSVPHSFPARAEPRSIPSSAPSPRGSRPLHPQFHTYQSTPRPVAANFSPLIHRDPTGESSRCPATVSPADPCTSCTT